jgi:polyhydroxyalkanoate synthesis repressor PhaR
MIIVKRYPNRKLYNTDAKRYVTLDQLAELIHSGDEVQILDHHTGEDLTAVTLTQIIFEQEKKQGGYLPRSVLTGLIQSGGQTLANLRKSLASPLDLFHHVDLEIERRINSLIEQGKISAEEGEQLSDLLNSEAPHGSEPSTLSDAHLERILTAKGVPTQEDLQQLNENLDELVVKLDQLSKEPEQSTPSDNVE